MVENLCHRKAPLLKVIHLRAPVTNFTYYSPSSFFILTMSKSSLNSTTVLWLFQRYFMLWRVSRDNHLLFTFFSPFCHWATPSQGRFTTLILYAGKHWAKGRVSQPLTWKMPPGRDNPVGRRMEAMVVSRSQIYDALKETIVDRVCQ